MLIQNIKEAYVLAEMTRIKLWEAIIEDKEIEYEDGSIPDGLISTEVNDDYIKVTVQDILPKDVSISKPVLRDHWLRIMHQALKDVNKQFDKVLCVIAVYCPTPYWDVDNRAYKYIIDSLRHNRIIPDDKHSNLSFMVIGGVDRESPRTEIYILKHPNDILNLLVG